MPSLNHRGTTILRGSLATILDTGCSRAAWYGIAMLLIAFVAVTACGAPRLSPQSRVTDPRIQELSGLTNASTDGTFWCLNDSGNPAEIFRINAAGQVLQSVTIEGASNIDWEALSRDQEGRLLIGDVGDNARRRQVYTIYRVPEPAAGQVRVSPDATIEFRYGDSVSRDCESIFVFEGRIYLVSKEAGRPTAIFQLSAGAALPAEGNVASRDWPATGSSAGDGLGQAPVTFAPVAEFVAEIPNVAGLTDASYSHERGELAILSYVGFATARMRSEGDLLHLQPVVRPGFFGQAEALCFDGDDLLVTNEKGAIWRFGLQPH